MCRLLKPRPSLLLKLGETDCGRRLFTFVNWKLPQPVGSPEPDGIFQGFLSELSKAPKRQSHRRSNLQALSKYTNTKTIQRQKRNTLYDKGAQVHKCTFSNNKKKKKKNSKRSENRIWFSTPNGQQSALAHPQPPSRPSSSTFSLTPSSSPKTRE